jgi:pimeloyl-ACP methyl ester carboxylesterase
MNAFFFGERDRQLFGVYTPPRGGARGGQAVLLCYPFGSEHMRAHRAFRQLSGLLNRAGSHVLRFDYFGTGDSAGRGDEASLEQWVQDIGTAVDELKDTCGATTVSLIGLRLGAALAAAAAAQRTDIDRVILWDPIVDGSRYLSEMQAIAGRPQLRADEPMGVTGFPVTGGMRQALSALDLRTSEPPRAKRIDIIAASEQPEYPALEQAWRARGAVAHYTCIPSAGDWAMGDVFGSALLPQDIIQGIVTSMTQGQEAA